MYTYNLRKGSLSGAKICLPQERIVEDGGVLVSFQPLELFLGDVESLPHKRESEIGPTADHVRVCGTFVLPPFDCMGFIEEAPEVQFVAFSRTSRAR